MAALLLAEVALRLTGQVFEGSLYVPDPETGWSLRPQSAGWVLGEGRNYIRISSQGLRDREHTIAKPGGVLRVAVLGDSFAEAANVAGADAFWSVLERELGRCPSMAGRTVEAVNFGVSGYGTAQELLTLRKKVWKFNPDIVLLAFYTGNDILDNHRALNVTSNGGLVPYFALTDNGLVLDESFQRSPRLKRSSLLLQGLTAGLINRSYLVQMIYQARRNIRQQQAAQKFQDMDLKIYRPPEEANLKEAWRVTEELIRTMNREVRAGGAEFWLVVLSTSDQVHPDPAVRGRLRENLGLETLLYSDHRLQDLGAREGFPVVVLADPLAAYAEENRTHLHTVTTSGGKSHWNEAGHRLAGQIIASQLCSGSSAVKGRKN